MDEMISVKNIRVLGKVSKKKLVEFSTKSGGGFGWVDFQLKEKHRLKILEIA